jgi:hypothetical protein
MNISWFVNTFKMPLFVMEMLCFPLGRKRFLKKKSTEWHKSHATLGTTRKVGWQLSFAAFGAFGHPQRASANILTASDPTVLVFSSVLLREDRT